MQPWIDKAGSSSGGSSTLHYDKTLSHLNHHHPSQYSSGSSKSGFRTGVATPSRDLNNTSSQHHYTDKPSSYQPSYDFSPIHQHTHDNMMLSDGADVLNFLNSTEYSDHIHGDDLKPDSMSYISHRHQLDTQHALSEKEKLNHQWTAELMASENIVEYLMNSNYTEDIYGIPIIGQWIKEAKKEITQDSTSENSKKAIARLSMIRHHLVEKASGNIELAAQNALRMNENDWSSTFLDSSM